MNARAPASFVIRAGGKLSPASVSAPAFLALQVSIDSTDASSHQVKLRTPTPRTLTVSSHGRASVLIPGLRSGAYAIDVDGMLRGSLLIGGEPGP